MITLKIGENFLHLRETPWDTEILGFRTNEILEVHYQNQAGLSSLLGEFVAYNQSNEISLTLVRVDSNEKQLRHLLQKFGFYYMETSLVVSLPSISKLDTSKLFPSKFILCKPAGKDFDEIKRIAMESFHYGRFHEDVNIATELACQRNYNWIDNLIAQNEEFLVLKLNDKVCSFMIAHTENNITTFILGGSSEEKGFLSPFFWTLCLKHFQENSTKVVRTIISASNIAILNLYMRLGFVVEKTLIGLHWHRSKS